MAVKPVRFQREERTMSRKHGKDRYDPNDNSNQTQDQNQDQDQDQDQDQGQDQDQAQAQAELQAQLQGQGQEQAQYSENLNANLNGNANYNANLNATTVDVNVDVGLEGYEPSDDDFADIDMTDSEINGMFNVKFNDVLSNSLNGQGNDVGNVISQNANLQDNDTLENATVDNTGTFTQDLTAREDGRE